MGTPSSIEATFFCIQTVGDEAQNSCAPHPPIVHTVIVSISWKRSLCGRHDRLVMAGTGQLACAMQETQEAEICKLMVLVVTLFMGLVDGVVLKGWTAFVAGRDAYEPAHQTPP